MGSRIFISCPRFSDRGRYTISYSYADFRFSDFLPIVEIVGCNSAGQATAPAQVLDLKPLRYVARQRSPLAAPRTREKWLGTNGFPPFMSSCAKSELGRTCAVEQGR